MRYLLKHFINGLFIIAFLLFSCKNRETNVKADLIILGGTIYTVAGKDTVVEAVAIKKDRIIFAGSERESLHFKGDSTQMIDLQGATMTPGFIEGHGHFMGMGFNALSLDLSGIENYDSLAKKVKEAVDRSKPGEWITGRGWHQSKWFPQPDTLVMGFQTHEKLSAVSPDNPVFLRHASGHAGFANKKAMDIAGVNQLSVEAIDHDEEGGEVIRDRLGNPTGIFTERAMGFISSHIPTDSLEVQSRALEIAVESCLRNGITSFHDAGISPQTLDLYQQAKANGLLKVRLYAMLSGTNQPMVEEWLQKGPEIDTVEYLLTIRSFKLSCDGALGSRGAWLLEDYTDRTGHAGHNTLPMEYVQDLSEKALKAGFQVCSHAIGDRANREVLDRYEAAFARDPLKAKDHRFRIEHAQHIHPDDIPRFAAMGVIPAMQAIHMSSDRPWAIDRLGEKRIVEGAYMWQKLLESGARIVNGTDVPVEPINPLASFYASVTRKTLEGEPENGYEPAQKMTREQALRSYTLDAAFGAFEEDLKGSVEAGKLADFTVFDKDIMTIPEGEILRTKVIMTIVGGKIVYQNK
ncbi:MAG: amidohydrolase [Cyclobacteriaceae bacterium]|nr:amidohydrolase [Cyclobacteriaceae bacterium]